MIWAWNSDTVAGTDFPYALERVTKGKSRPWGLAKKTEHFIIDNDFSHEMPIPKEKIEEELRQTHFP